MSRKVTPPASNVSPDEANEFLRRPFLHKEIHPPGEGAVQLIKTFPKHLLTYLQASLLLGPWDPSTFLTE